MEMVFFELASLLILIPLIYYLPIGLTTRGKIVLVSIAFVIANLGLIAREVLPIWQIMSLLLLLALVVAYLLNRRKGDLFLTSNEKEGIAQHDDTELIMNYFYEKSSEQKVGNTKEMIDNGNTEEFEKELTDGNLDAFSEIGASIEEEIPSINNVLEENEQLNMIQNPITEFVQSNDEEELHFVSNIVELNQEETDLLDVDKKLEESGYLSDIEQMLIDEGANDFDFPNEKTEVIESTYVEELLKNEYEDLYSQNDVLSSSVSEIDEFDNHFDKTQKNEQSQYVIEEVNFDEIQIEEVKLEPELKNDELFDDDFVEHPEVIDSKKLRLMEQLFDTIISQIQLSKNQLSNEQYEYLIKEQMIQGLPDQIYYSFASLLIEHYIRTEERDQLQHLLIELKDKCAKFPLIKLEIEYLYEQNKRGIQ